MVVITTMNMTTLNSLFRLESLLYMPGPTNTFPPSENHATSNGSSSNAELEAVKQEILKEMRKEIGKAKQEIIDGED